MANKQRKQERPTVEEAVERRRIFVEAYLSNGQNATKAAMAAGYSTHPKTANSAGCRLLKHPEVVARLDERRRALAQKFELTTEKNLQEVARIAYCDPRKIMAQDGSIKLPHELDEDTAAAIASFEVSFDGSIKYKFWPKTQALDMANKIMGNYEKDNRQKIAPLRELLESLTGNLTGVAQ